RVVTNGSIGEVAIARLDLPTFSGRGNAGWGGNSFRPLALQLGLQDRLNLGIFRGRERSLDALNVLLLHAQLILRAARVFLTVLLVEIQRIGQSLRIACGRGIGTRTTGGQCCTPRRCCARPWCGGWCCRWCRTRCCRWRLERISV